MVTNILRTLREKRREDVGLLIAGWGGDKGPSNMKRARQTKSEDVEGYLGKSAGLANRER